MNFGQRLAVLAILWLPFSAGALASILYTLADILIAKRPQDASRAKRVLDAMDRLLAALLGFSGEHTLSAELGVTTDERWFWLRDLLDKIQPGHCEGAAANENLKAPE